MIVKCVNKENVLEQITVGKEYLVLEICFSEMRECISYRLINNDGRPTIYNASCFTVVSNDLRDMVFDYYGDFCIITHKRFFDTAIGKDNVNGFWAHLFETDDLEALKLVESVAHDINFDQRIILPEIKLR